MQIIGKILIGLTVFYWLYKIAKKIEAFFDYALEAGFRDKFPLDYLSKLSTFIDFFKKYGFARGRLIDPGSDKPGIEMVKEGHNIEIYLDAPLNLDEKQKNEIEIVFKAQAIKIRTLEMTDECRKLLSEALTIIKDDNDSSQITA